MKCLLIGLLLCLTSSALANDTWLEDPVNHPPIQRKVANKKFWIAATAMALSSLADGITTRRALNQGAVEMNPLFGRRPSNLRLFGTGSLLTVGEITAVYYLKKWDDPNSPSHAWLVPVGLQIGAETFLAVHNERLANRLNRFHHGGKL